MPARAGMCFFTPETELMNRSLRGAAAFALLAAACAAQASRQAAMPGSEFDPGLTGRVSMEGAILSSACDITTGDNAQTVAMGSETRGHMKRTGQGEPHPFSISLTHCALAQADDPAPWQVLQVTFDGEREDGLFRVGGMASGVALELTDSRGAVIRPGEAVSYRQAAADDIRLDYYLTLKTTTRELMAGDYRAVIRYRVDYF